MARASKKQKRPHRHELYERAVQHPESEVEFVDRTFRKLRGRRALTLREDFAGTSIFSLEWARSHSEREAWGVDLDEPTLEWGRKHRIEPAGAEVASRVHQIRGNVLDVHAPKVEVSTAFNFSYWLWKTRDELRRYFEVVHSQLTDDGLFFVDIYGGTDVPKRDHNRINHGDFIYEWEQASFDVLTHHLVCHIHFELRDGTQMRKAFTYDWRWWTIPEIRELMLEAGFSDVHVFWERTDDEGDGTGVFYRPKRMDNDEVWWTFMVAER